MARQFFPGPPIRIPKCVLIEYVLWSKSMRLSYRLILSLIAGVTAVSISFAVYPAGAEAHALKDEVQREALVLAESQQRSVEPLLESGNSRDLQALVDRFRDHERMAGMAVYDAKGQPLAITPGPASRLGTT